MDNEKEFAARIQFQLNLFEEIGFAFGSVPIDISGVLAREFFNLEKELGDWRKITASRILMAYERAVAMNALDWACKKN